MVAQAFDDFPRPDYCPTPATCYACPEATYRKCTEELEARLEALLKGDAEA